jgi:cytochrome bd-type quinol oxidase subunit 1
MAIEIAFIVLWIFGWEIVTTPIKVFNEIVLRGSIARNLYQYRC